MKSKKLTTVSGVVVDPLSRTMQGMELTIRDGVIVSRQKRDSIRGPFILPGFIDAHVHIESSMLIPSRFAAMAVKHGTVGVVTDPHEVANVAGTEGIRFMMKDASTSPMGFYFGVPSCVPASPLEKSGAIITEQEVLQLLESGEFYYLSEMMNFPGVVFDDPQVHQKLVHARNMKMPVDGHAPGLSGTQLKKYIKAGITTDHECSSLNEAEEKLSLGMKILIREGSAARNFDALIPLMEKYSNQLMFCTDDCHPDYLSKGHINKMVSRGLEKGYDIFDLLDVACVNPVKHYNLPVGLLQEGESADFVVITSLEQMQVQATWIGGEPVFYQNSPGISLPERSAPVYPFRDAFQKGLLRVVASGSILNVIEAIDGELFTRWKQVNTELGREVVIDTNQDLLKIVLLDRYAATEPVVAYINGFGLKKGAMACSVAHDSHHIIAVGCSEPDLDVALQWVVQKRGGMCFTLDGETKGIELPYFGLMSDVQGEEVALEYEQLSALPQMQGSSLSAPFMTLSFMALTVIPQLKINHKGLFNSQDFQNISLFQQA